MTSWKPPNMDANELEFDQVVKGEDGFDYVVRYNNNIKFYSAKNTHCFVRYDNLPPIASLENDIRPSAEHILLFTSVDSLEEEVGSNRQHFCDYSSDTHHTSSSSIDVTNIMENAQTMESRGRIVVPVTHKFYKAAIENPYGRNNITVPPCPFQYNKSNSHRNINYEYIHFCTETNKRFQVQNYSTLNSMTTRSGLVFVFNVTYSSPKNNMWESHTMLEIARAVEKTYSDYGKEPGENGYELFAEKMNYFKHKYPLLLAVFKIARERCAVYIHTDERNEVDQIIVDGYYLI